MTLLPYNRLRSSAQRQVYLVSLKGEKTTVIISIVTPTLNAERYLAQCIDSVRSNASGGIEPEHVIVDGGSTDQTTEIARAKGVRLIEGKDSGIFDAINKGSFASSGELLGFLGADDLLLDGALQALVNAYRQGQPRWLSGSFRWIDKDGTHMMWRSAPPTWLGLQVYASLGWSSMAHMSTYLTRDLFEELGGFNIAFKLAGDYELFARAWSRCAFRRIRRPLAAFRFTETNYSFVHEARKVDECNAIAESFAPKSSRQRKLYRMALRNWMRADKLSWRAKEWRARPQAM